MESIRKCELCEQQQGFMIEQRMKKRSKLKLASQLLTVFVVERANTKTSQGLNRGYHNSLLVSEILLVNKCRIEDLKWCRRACFFGKGRRLEEGLVVQHWRLLKVRAFLVLVSLSFHTYLPSCRILRFSCMIRIIFILIANETL